MSIVGQTYLERGEPVAVVAQWRAGKPLGIGSTAHLYADGEVCTVHILSGYGPRRSGPRNVLIRRANGDLVVRPFRGLRRTS